MRARSRRLLSLSAAACLIAPLLAVAAGPAGAATPPGFTDSVAIGGLTQPTAAGVASGSFTAPDHEYPSYVDLALTATDSDGHSTSTTRRLDPRTVVLTFTSSPNGALLVVGATSATAPFSRTVIVGSTTSISAPSPQLLGAQGRRYEFRKWSDGGARTHNITAPASATTYQAIFKQSR